MAEFNPNNERIKREYSEFLREADQKAEATVRAIEKALLRYEEHTGCADFATFSRAQAMSFRAFLSSPPEGVRRLSNATILSTLKAVQRFFRWLALQPGMKSQIKPADIAYLNLSEKDVRAAGAAPSRPFPSMDQLKTVLAHMPGGSPIERRDRALFALIMLTGMRDNAAASLRLRHVDLDRQMIVQDPASVRTKNSKLIESILLPLGREVEDAFVGWVEHLRHNLAWEPNDPLFPQTMTRIDPVRGPVAEDLKRRVWSSAEPVRVIFRRAFGEAGIPYFPPHRVRDSVVAYAYETCRTPEELKAFSQNLGHANVVTTLTSYGTIPLTRQRDLIRNAGKTKDLGDKIDLILDQLSKGAE
ncbi:MAG: tyrosine-type recombinase/integrase [Pseudomonadota bacterium]